MFKKSWLLISLVLIVSMLLASCASPAEPAPAGEAPAAPSGEKVKISFFHKWPEPEQLEYYNYVISEFNKVYPNIEVEMEAASDEAYKDKIRVLMASGEVPDIYFSWAGEFSWKFARAGQALDITDALMNTDWKDSIILSAVEPYKVEGKVYGIPMRINAKFMVYNKDMFEQLGLSVPTTWDEFLAVCEALKTAGITPLAFGNEFPWASAHYVGDFNAKLVNGDVLKADYLLTAEPDALFTDPGLCGSFDPLQDAG